MQCVTHVLGHIYTLFLFTKSDIKTTVVPITVLASASAPLRNYSRLPHIIFWIWMHVLQFDVSNQTQNPGEDAHNKRDRPLPSKRISWEDAVTLRWLLVPVCWTLSACYSIQTFCSSVALVALTITYNELGAHSGHWAVRNIVNALGFASFEVGACLVAGANPYHLDKIAWMSVLVSAGIFATTIQAQDFKDVEGDTIVGRRTLPIVLPALARPTLALALLAWSIGLCALWQADVAITVTINALSLAVGTYFMTAKTVQADQRAFYLYNLWLSYAHALPLCWRYHHKF